MGDSAPRPDDEWLTRRRLPAILRRVGVIHSTPEHNRSVMPEHLDASALIELARRAESVASAPCSCTRASLDDWQSQPLSLDETQFQEIGTLVSNDEAEPAFSEFLPGKTSYWSSERSIVDKYVCENRSIKINDLRMLPGAARPEPLCRSARRRPERLFGDSSRCSGASLNPGIAP
jgi:hypothetical protein